LPGSGWISVGHWVTDGLLAVFFFLAAIELEAWSRTVAEQRARHLCPTIATVAVSSCPPRSSSLMVPRIAPENHQGAGRFSATDIAALRWGLSTR
jgi:Na+/H+ antiporter NhaA